MGDISDIRSIDVKKYQAQSAADALERGRKKDKEPSLQNKQAPTQDTVTLTGHQAEALKIQKWVEALKSMPDVRDEELDRAQKNLDSGKLFSPEVISQVTKEIMKDLRPLL